MASLPYPRSLLAVILSHRFHRSAQNLLAVISSHRIHRIHRTFVEKGLPQIARIYTDVGGYGILPYPRNH